MNESITKAAGASFGQELNLDDVDRIARSLDLDLDPKKHPLSESSIAKISELI